MSSNEVVEDTMTASWSTEESFGGHMTASNSGSPERPSSAMSSGSSSTTSSRIPVPKLNRSASLRLKASSKTNLSSNDDGSSISQSVQLTSQTPEHAANNTRNVTPHRDVTTSTTTTTSQRMYRSASFASTRGMKDLLGSSSTSRPPEVVRKAPGRSESLKRFSYVSPYSKKAIAMERKAQSYAGVPTGCRHNNPHCHHIITSTTTSSASSVSKRPASLPLSSVTSPDQHDGPMPRHSDHLHSPSLSDHLHDLDQDDDADSVKSFDSINSAMSCDTAMRSLSSWGRSNSKKYVVHCHHNPHVDPDDYLTPTQRAARRIRDLKSQLIEARKEITSKQEQITQLTRELVLLRLHSVQDKSTDVGCEDPIKSSSAEDGSSRLSPKSPCSTKQCVSPQSEGSSEPELERLAQTSQHSVPATVSSPQPLTVNSPCSMSETVDSVDVSQRSLADSGNYDDLASPSLSIKDPLETSRTEIRSHDDLDEEDESWAAAGAIEDSLRREYDRRIDEMKRNSLNEYNELKERHNDKVEALLAKLSEANLKYFELRPEHDRCVDKLKESESTIKRLKDELSESERKHQKMYLQMYMKGQEAAKLEVEDNILDSISMGARGSITSLGESPFSPENKTVSGLMKQLTHAEEELEKIKVMYRREVSRNKKQVSSRDSTSSTGSGTSTGTPSCDLDPEVTLQFLKSAIYYFLTDRDNSRGHLRAIESILGYTTGEKKNIEKLSRI